MTHDSINEDNQDSPFKTHSALLVSILALVLAIATLGGSNATKDATMENILASNAYSFYQAKSQRQTTFKVAAEQTEALLANDRLPAKQRDLLAKNLAKYRETISRYESEPDTGEGKKELLQKAKAHEKNRDVAIRRDPWFDYAGALLQIAIVLTSLAIITSRKFFFHLSVGLGGIGTLCTIQGYLLL
jgi:hypothetical protein